MESGVKILIVDDEPQILKVLGKLLETLGHEVVAEGDSNKALKRLTTDDFDLVISDIKMPKIGGLDMARRVHEVNPELPVVLVTGFPELETAREAIRVGVDGYVSKPVQIAELDRVIKSALAKKTLGMDRTIGELLDLCKAAGQMEKRYIDALREIARLVETGRDYARGHETRVGAMAETLAKRMHVSQEDIVAIRLGAELREIGLIGVPVELLSKREALSDAERRIVRRHPVVGSGLLARLPINVLVHKIVLHHHDRYDGADSASGLPAKDIPLGAHIVIVVDAFDAMTSHRPWRKSLSRQTTLGIVAANAGTQFHPEVARTFLQMMEFEPGKG